MVQSKKTQAEWKFCTLAEGISTVLTPWNRTWYDVGIDRHDGRLYKIKIRNIEQAPYHISTDYRRKTFDYLAVYIAPEDIWYIIPFAAIKKSMRFNPNNGDTEMAQYKDNWDPIRRKD
jgi:hypothetical protein